MGLTIDKDLCTGCEACVDECPYEALDMVDDIARVNDSCNLCKACLDVCPVEAIGLEEIERQAEARTGDASGVWVLAEQRGGKMPEVVAELLGQGRKLADDLEVELAAVLLGHQITPLAADLFAWGADKVFVADDGRLADYNDDIYSEVITTMIADHRPEIFLAGATSFGRSLVPRLATQAATGLTADCTGLEIDKGRRLLLQTRPAFGGNIMATIVCPHARPQMATVRPRVMKAGGFMAGRQGELVEWPVNGDLAARTRVLEVIDSVEEKVNLCGAEVIVTGGRGLGKLEGFELVNSLAEALGGVVGASRGAVDSEWIGYAHQVGQTGKTVSPKLYVALGVSGAVQHLVGMQGSDNIVAVNTDPNAPIFTVATYGIVGDLYEVVPAMLERLGRSGG